MQETNDSSSRKQLTLQQLLHLKRLERPAADFWPEFERELQEKQLRALVKPSRSARLRELFLPRLALFAPFTAAAACLIISLTSISFDTPRAGESGAVLRHEAQPGQQVEMAELEPAEMSDLQSAGRHSLRMTDRQFVVDALVPEKIDRRPFRTESVPETFVASGETSAHYVVNAFTSTSGLPAHIDVPEAVLEF